MPIMTPISRVKSDGQPLSPPSYLDIDDATGGSQPSPVGKQKRGFAQKILGLFPTTHSHLEPRNQVLKTKILDILVHAQSPQKTQVMAKELDYDRRRVTVEVRVAASVTAKSRHASGQPAISTHWLATRTAKATFRRSSSGNPHSIALATEKATRKAAKEAHKGAVAIATMHAAAAALEAAAEQFREA